MSVARLKRMFVNAFFYFRHEVDLENWTGVDYRLVCQYQIQAYCNAEFLQEWRAPIPVASDIRGYLPLIKPTKLGMPMPDPQYIQTVNESGRNVFIFKENDPQVRLKGNIWFHMEPHKAKSIVPIKKEDFDAVPISDPPLSYEYRESLVTLLATDLPQKILLGRLEEHFCNYPVYKAMLALEKRRVVQQKHKKDADNQFINLDDVTTVDNISFNS